MRQYAWYSPEIDVIVLQEKEDPEVFMIADKDLVEKFYPVFCAIDDFLWLPLGEL